MVELVDTPGSGPGASAWGFDSPSRHYKERHLIKEFKNKLLPSKTDSYEHSYGENPCGEVYIQRLDTCLLRLRCTNHVFNAIGQCTLCGLQKFVDHIGLLR